MTAILAFFGAFNPPTLAHLELARFAMEQTGREKVLFVPSKSAYIREEQGKDYAYSDQQRLAMLRAAAEKRPWMAVTDWEMRQPRQPRTYDTLCHLRDMGYAPSLLLGSDKLPELETVWTNVDRICKEFGMVCLARGGDPCGQMLRQDAYLRSLSPYIQLLETPPDFRALSSTAVRRAVAQYRALEREIKAMVPEEVFGLL